MAKEYSSKRKLLDRVIACIFILVVGYVGWIIADKFYYASSRRSANAAVSQVELIREAQIQLKPKYGRYLSIDELIQEKAISPKIKNPEYAGYTFRVDISEEKFLIHAVPSSDKSGVAFSMDEKGNVLR